MGTGLMWDPSRGRRPAEAINQPPRAKEWVCLAQA